MATSTFTKRLEGKVALITGGAAGAGEATARLFVQHGAKVVLIDVNDDLGRQVAADIGPEDVIAYVHGDVSVEADVSAAVDYAVSKYGGLDIMFNNAAIVDHKNVSHPKITESHVAGFERVLAVNVTGVFLGTKHAARVMAAAGRGRGGVVLNNGSVASVVGGVASHSYVASKHAVVGLTKNAAAELGQYGIRVNCISSYMYASKLTVNATNKQAKEMEAWIGSMVNLKGVVLTADDVAKAALFFASDEAKYVTGHNLIIDGGLTTINNNFGIFNH